MCYVSRPGSSRALQPHQRKHRKHATYYLMEYLLQRAPEPCKSASRSRLCARNQSRAIHVHILSHSHCSGRFRMAFALPSALYRWPVNALETTRALPLVSNLSQSYNRHCGWGDRALQLDDHLKNLLRELGHAINDTVSESDRITGAIAGVRAHGYDIVLKLDATIGLARRDAAGNQDSKLTTLDRRFLESLRIQVDQDSFNEPDLERKAVGKLAMTAQDIRFLKSLRIATEDPE